MKFEILDFTDAKLTSINPRNEKHGPDALNPAIDLTYTMDINNSALSMFDGHLLSALYFRSEAATGDGKQASIDGIEEVSNLPNLRFPAMSPFAWGKELSGYTHTISHGMGGKSDIHLIEQRRPAAILGEQVASRDADPWIDLIQDDLEGLGYGVGAVPFPSAGIGAPHIRDRLYWMAYAGSQGLEKRVRHAGEQGRAERRRNAHAGGGGACQLEHPRQHDDASQIATSRARQPQAYRSTDQLGRPGIPFGTGPGPVNGHWSAADWLLCRDGKWRPVEPGTFPLAHGTPARVGRLRAYGNAINAEAACIFIEAAMSCMP